jgi:hypothetical protein
LLFLPAISKWVEDIVAASLLLLEISPVPCLPFLRSPLLRLQITFNSLSFLSLRDSPYAFLGPGLHPKALLGLCFNPGPLMPLQITFNALRSLPLRYSPGSLQGLGLVPDLLPSFCFNPGPFTPLQITFNTLRFL